MWTCKYDLNTVRVDTDFLKYRAKISVFENIRIRRCGGGLRVHFVDAHSNWSKRIDILVVFVDLYIELSCIYRLESGMKALS